MSPKIEGELHEDSILPTLYVVGGTSSFETLCQGELCFLGFRASEWSFLVVKFESSILGDTNTDL